ncbi:Nif3-like dinuclear metal center hexameric protein [Oceanicoccus sp. KOV_DT_Chl]|uniref:Nif3-like dinuclear metal center hexameric protein n=1 Tax=Oceanicoccus sp. KOV_DT_Chl TaxID=1904639 RepID=UPI000C79689E|nr:Nif3-like dinuclear metal center hexameric protein [Oceanicoccus sp. KOV_DT_Chl]
MSVDRQVLLQCCNELLTPGEFSDYCPNGLQVQGVEKISTLVAGVTANQALIERAIEQKADAILVHHGFFWKGEDPCITGVKFRRIQSLLEHNINLIAYHLPLDAHPTLGNNARLAQLLGITIADGLEMGNPNSVGNIGYLAEAMSAQDFCQRIGRVLQREPLLVDAGDHLIKSIGWCTGGAQSYLGQAAARGVDAYLSGEISEATVHDARELGVHYIAAGHHATERYGVQAVAEYLAEKFDLDYQYIDIDSPA